MANKKLWELNKQERLRARKRAAGAKDRRRPDRRAAGKPAAVSEASEPRPLIEAGMTVGELRRALDGIPDGMSITIRASQDDGNAICGAITHASVETGCGEDDDGNPLASFCIDATDHIETIQDADADRHWRTTPEVSP